ncbi:MAG: ATP phosphoribosyltransferase regulatory subunit [Sporolactobacillus sp.]
MTQPYMFEKPLGLRDYLPLAHRAVTGLESIVHEELLRWGYDFLQTPALEYVETVGRASAIEDSQLFKFLDIEGHPVVLRPDMTTPIARLAASRLSHEPLPLRLGYSAALDRIQKRVGGHPSEFKQTGAELIGDATPYADAEAISLMTMLLQKTGLPSIRLAIGHVGFVNAFLRAMTKEQAAVDQLRHLLYVKNDVGFRKYASKLAIPKENLEKLLLFIDSRRMNNASTLAFLQQMAEQARSLHPYYQAIMELTQLLQFNHVDEKIDLDVTLMPHLSYYTGIVFQGFGGGLGFPVASGGRYDHLLAQFNRPCPATGFGIRMDRLMRAVHVEGMFSAQQKEAIIYDQANAEKALQAARAARDKGVPVVLQHAAAIADYASFIKQFRKVYRFLGEEAGSETMR